MYSCERSALDRNVVVVINTSVLCTGNKKGREKEIRIRWVGLRFRLQSRVRDGGIFGKGTRSLKKERQSLDWSQEVSERHSVPEDKTWSILGKNEYSDEQ